MLCSLLPLSALALVQDAPLERFQPVVAEEGRLELEAAWEPCRGSLYGLFDRTPALRAPRVAVERASYEAAAFEPLLPTEPVALGELWKVDAGAALHFLRQLHPGATSNASFFGGEVPGTWAMLRAVGTEAYEILLRTHASFELDGGVIYKPAQFEGRLVVGRESGELFSFSFALPSRDTNVDVNVPLEERRPPARDGREHEEPKGEGSDEVAHTPPAFVPMQADIGWVPRMELASSHASEPIEWTHEVPDEKARLALRRAFYRFAALDWLPFEEAVLAAREEQKPLHLVLMFGCLDDDSC